MRVRVASLLVLSMLCLSARLTATAPWAAWPDLSRLATVFDGHQVLLRSSHCPSACRFDRHSSGDGRYLRQEGAEGVIFDQPGAGAITRIWMTSGMGVSMPLDPAVRIRFYFDGEATPTIDLPLPALFDGSVEPFTPPLTATHQTASGGFLSDVPLPFREGCKVTLEGADDYRLWFQFTYHRLASAAGVVTFIGDEDLGEWRQLLSSPGLDPWPTNPSATIENDVLTLQPGEARTVWNASGQGMITALLLDIPPADRSRVDLRLRFDGEITADLPLSDAFAYGRGGDLPTRSLLVGEDAEGLLYLYFPMPYQSSAGISLTETGAARRGSSVTLTWEVRHLPAAPDPAAGRFGIQRRSVASSTPGEDLPLLKLGGSGKWVGLFADLSAAGDSSRQYLEGDERVYLDASTHPLHYGTGVEDFFSGGFYFDQGPFRRALHGAPYHLLPPSPGEEDVTAAYRLMVADAVPFRNGIRAELETGPIGDIPLRALTVAYYYRRTEPLLEMRDELDLGDPQSRLDHQYQVTGASTDYSLDAKFQDEPPTPLLAEGVRRPPGPASFVLSGVDAGDLVRLRRLLDAGIPGQTADVVIGGRVVATFPPVAENPSRRFEEVDVDLDPTRVGSGQLSVEVVVRDEGPAMPREFTAFRYQLWAGRPPSLLFADGFESGTTGAWQLTVP